MRYVVVYTEERATVVTADSPEQAKQRAIAVVTGGVESPAAKKVQVVDVIEATEEGT